MTLEWASEPFQRKSWGVRLNDTLPDTFYTQRDGSIGEGSPYGELPKPGALRYEEGFRGSGQYKDVQCTGPCWFRWGVNRSGSAFANFTLARRTADLAVTVDATGTVSTLTDSAAFIADEEVGNLLFILNNSASAGALPEGSWADIVKNTADTLTFQPAMSAATVATDTAIIQRQNHLALLGGAIERHEAYGVTMAESVADNYWGWFLAKGICTIQTKTGEAFAAGEGLIGSAGGLVDSSSTSGQDIMLARCISANVADLASDLVVAFFDLIHGTPFTTT